VLLDPRADRFIMEFTFTIRLGPGSYSILVSVVECSEDLSVRIPADEVNIGYVFEVPFDTLNPVWYLFDEPVTANAAVFFDTPPG
jgi:hypothetical protein